MGRQCVTCMNAKVDEIDAKLILTDNTKENSVRALAKEFNCSEAALYRHKKNCLKFRMDLVPDYIKGEKLLEVWEKQLNALYEIQAKCKKLGNIPMQIQIARTINDYILTGNKLMTPEQNPNQINIITSNLSTLSNEELKLQLAEAVSKLESQNISQPIIDADFSIAPIKNKNDS